MEEKDESLTELINYEAGYRTAPATPGLLAIGKELMGIRMIKLPSLLFHLSLVKCSKFE